MTDYSKVKIINIRRGKGERSIFWYATVVDENDEVVINATLDWCIQEVKERIDTQALIEANELIKAHINSVKPEV